MISRAESDKKRARADAHGRRRQIAQTMNGGKQQWVQVGGSTKPILPPALYHITPSSTDQQSRVCGKGQGEGCVTEGLSMAVRRRHRVTRDGRARTSAAYVEGIAEGARKRAREGEKKKRESDACWREGAAE